MASRKKTGGRQQGTPNKITKTVREMVLGALDEVGGQRYLVKQAREKPEAYMTLLGKCLPKDVNTIVTDAPRISAIKLVPLVRGEADD